MTINLGLADLNPVRFSAIAYPRTQFKLQGLLERIKT